MEMNNYLPSELNEAVLKQSVALSDNVAVKGIDYTAPEATDMKASDLVKAMKTMGFQASSIGQACEIIDEMRSWRGKHIDELEDVERKGEFDVDGFQKTTIFMGVTSNIISSGIRETIRFLVQHKMVSALVMTAGGVEEDLIKCLADTYLGEFSLKGASLREKGLNRIGNLLVPNDNYCKFEEWVIPVLDKMLEEQEEHVRIHGNEALHANASKESPIWTPSSLCDRLGKEINDESSVLYWAHKNKIPVFCPAITDGSIGDMLFFHTFKSHPSQLRLDIVADIRRINTMAMEATSAGMIILGGGVIKHHIANACLMRNGADFAVYINTGQEFDGSDAGASTDEAVSWGKIKSEAKAVKVFADVTTVFPLIVAATFANGKDVVKDTQSK
ncbi:HBR340Wp [Eremothecium sinecaudum]|uniref:Deoxyhypusine synthase n=1 Tax=Eremothecium sinecaudum TaxID=45286 RepID=A0A109UXA2_9SACH|nr:HBR340Wp [Eremothecium sinecaudum]AMD19241.1 HBR340Wp [Eremothecium sinecaudum]